MIFIQEFPLQTTPVKVISGRLDCLPAVPTLPGRAKEGYGSSDNIVVREFSVDLLNDQPLDAVSDVLQALSVRSVVYCLSELRQPWGFRFECAQVAKFDLVL